MDIAFINSAVTHAASAQYIDATAPGDVADGRILMAGCMVYQSSNFTNLTPPAGWTQIAKIQSTDGGPNYRSWWCFWKRCSSESGAYRFDLDGTYTGYFSVTIDSFSGCITTGSPIDQFSNTLYTVSNKIARAAAITPTVADSMLWGWAGIRQDVSATCTPPTGMTESQDGYANNFLVSSAYLLGPTSGSSTGDKDFTASYNDEASGRKHAFLVNLKPVPVTFKPQIIVI